MKFLRRLSGLLLLLLLSGCYLYDEMQMVLYPEKKTGEIVFTNIWSDGKDEENILKDFGRFLDDYRNDSVLGPGVVVYERDLFERKGLLCARLRFRFTSPADLDVKLSGDGKQYLLKKDSTITYANGKEEAADGQMFYAWPVAVKKIEVKSASGSYSRSAGSVSLLPYWEKWKRGEIKAK